MVNESTGFYRLYNKWEIFSMNLMGDPEMPVWSTPPRTMTVQMPDELDRRMPFLVQVRHYLFGIRSSFSADQTTDIEECIRDGLHDVYSAYKWSFFRPVKYITTTAPYSTGTITIASGVVTLSGGTFPSWAAIGVLKVDSDYYDVDTRDGDTQITLEDTSPIHKSWMTL